MPKQLIDPDHIVKLYLDNNELTCKDIAIQLGISVNMVRAAFAACGVEPKALTRDAIVLEKCKRAMLIMKQCPELTLNQIALRCNTSVEKLREYAIANRITITASRFDPVTSARNRLKKQHWNRPADVGAAL